MKTTQLKNLKLISENNTLEIKKDEVGLNIYFNGKYLGDIHFSANSKGELIPQLFVISPFKLHNKLQNNNMFFRWGENKKRKKIPAIFENWNKLTHTLQLTKEDLRKISIHKIVRKTIKLYFPNKHNNYLLNKFHLILLLTKTDHLTNDKLATLIHINEKLDPKKWKEATKIVVFSENYLDTLKNNKMIKTDVIFNFYNKYCNYELNTIYLDLNITACNHEGFLKPITDFGEPLEPNEITDEPTFFKCSRCGYTTLL